MKNFINGNTLLYELRKTIVNLGFLKDDFGYEEMVFYHNNKKYWGEIKCKEKYNG